ncbi:MAG: tetratricopeptide repeat protein [Sedimentisphaerales bacterium]|nr:tetratricopeptide repeat protein [Sedimentisphaerales bacterium]
MFGNDSSKPAETFIGEPSCGGHSASEFLAAAAEAVRSGRRDYAAEVLDDRAIASVWRIFEADRSRTDLLSALAEILAQIGRVDEAERCYEKLLESGPNAAIYNKLGCLFQCTGRLSEAGEYLQKAVRTEPNKPELWANLARVLMEMGRMQEGIELLRRAVEKMPDNSQAHSNLLFRLHQMPELNRQRLFEEHKRWGRLHASAASAGTVHHNLPDPERRLRVGYISPDFRRHSVAYFFEPLLDGHDRREVEIYCYGNVEFRDQVTERLARKCDQYRDIRNLDDKAVAELIEQDGIDILVDLAGHVGDNNLLVMARRPAPVQVTWLGYPDTTGLTAIDYRLTDTFTDPPDSGAQRFYTEELVYLPDGFLCYSPPDFAPPIALLPAEKAGFVTFGSFNNSCKINSVVTELWARVLRANANSHLLLKLKGGGEPQIRDRYLKEFEKGGIGRSRLDILGWQGPSEHLRSYARMDIALDTYPYNGATTTCEALWMGVPTVSLVGQCHASRVGLSILSRVGLGFFAASTADEYVAKATALAGNLPALAQIRYSMRARIAASGLCYTRGFASQIESAYRQMWYRWCQSPLRRQKKAIGMALPVAETTVQPAARRNSEVRSDTFSQRT